MMTQQQPEYPALTKSYKDVYPFKICTTSFIYPDHYIPNVKMLGPYLDEIELLLFESQGIEALPSKTVITELCRLAGEFNLSYNVHLPTDISISDPDPARQQHAVETMMRVMELVRPLDASSLILHVPFGDKSHNGSIAAIWRDRVYQNLEKILSVVENKNIIAVETLDYPLDLLEDIIVDLDLTICLDLGHLMVYGYDLIKVYNKYGFRTGVIHLHGVENSRDHMTLERLSEKLASTVLEVLKRFSGVVSLEVFSFEDLSSSLKFLENHWGEELLRRDLP
jgi:sugar phosphate isomerase/epimerase